MIDMRWTEVNCSPLRVVIFSWQYEPHGSLQNLIYVDTLSFSKPQGWKKLLFFMLADVLGKSKIYATKIHIFPNCTQMEQHASTYFSAASAVCKVSAKLCFQQLTDVSIIHHFHKQTWRFFIWTSHVLEELRHFHDACCVD